MPHKPITRDELVELLMCFPKRYFANLAYNNDGPWYYRMGERGRGCAEEILYQPEDVAKWLEKRYRSKSASRELKLARLAFYLRYRDLAPDDLKHLREGQA